MPPTPKPFETERIVFYHGPYDGQALTIPAGKTVVHYRPDKKPTAAFYRRRVPPALDRDGRAIFDHDPAAPAAETTT